jgi:DNA-binding SARP family transcriptional activator
VLQPAQVLTYAILGPLEVRRDGALLPLAGQRQRALLAVLLLHGNDVVPTERLVDRLWGEHPPRTATTSLQNGISQLRKLLGADALETRPSGYLLSVEPEQLDLLRFEALTKRAQTEEPRQRVRTLREALALWRGSPLAELAFEPFAQGEIGRIEELRVGAIEQCVDAELELDPSGELVAELQGLVRDHPLRERLRAQLMLVLYRTGRQAEALQAYHDARRTLVDDLGIEPSRPLQQLFGQILRQERTLEIVADVQLGGGDDLGEVARAIATGRLVPVLGTSAGLATEEGVSTNAQLAVALADAFDCPPEQRGDLARVAQYVAVTRGVGPLYDELHAIFDRERAPGPVHRFLASLPATLRERGTPQQLIVTTAWDRSTERAFADAGEAIDVISYLALGRDRGKFVHHRAEGEAQVIHLPNAYTDVPLGERPVLLKIHGEVGLAPERDWESFVVSEDDYISYLAEAGIAGGLPVTVAARLRRSHFLFLGYGVVDWSLRVFLHRLWPDAQIGYRSWAVDQPSAVLEQEFWRRRGVEPVVAEIAGYAERLHGSILELDVVA